ncbi:MAG TPA: hypothetical protein DET40_24675 [Lentisphaeria bacterium]|nr:MAG: hypothetical protein A2X45_01330 [Lentisphaerae bacterium GWF2_50_93]HCE46755.1 hypothetical protein [Lentisphaeria bacterium]
MFRLIMSVLVIFLFGGCMSPIEEFTDKYYVLREKDANKLEGPYKVKDIVSSNTILLVDKDSREIKAIFRGCITTDDSKMNIEAMRGLGPLLDRDIYMLKDSVVWINAKEAKAILYQPANRIWVGHDENGKSAFRNLTYIMPQLLSIIEGEIIVDHSDTGYPLYEVFKEAERLAKENKKGYWATHSE